MGGFHVSERAQMHTIKFPSSKRFGTDEERCFNYCHYKYDGKSDKDNNKEDCSEIGHSDVSGAETNDVTPFTTYDHWKRNKGSLKVWCIQGCMKGLHIGNHCQKNCNIGCPNREDTVPDSFKHTWGAFSCISGCDWWSNIGRAAVVYGFLHRSEPDDDPRPRIQDWQIKGEWNDDKEETEWRYPIFDAWGKDDELLRLITCAEGPCRRGCKKACRNK